jgi:hypothetical protein
LGVLVSSVEVFQVAKRSAIGGLLCFAAGCLFIVFAMTKPGSNKAIQLGIGGVLVALGIFWLGPKPGRKKKDPQ